LLAVSSVGAYFRGMDKETKNAQLRAWRAKNKERLKAKKAEADRLYYLKNREKLCAASAKWAAAHPEQYKVNQTAYREAHKEQTREYGFAYRAANPEKRIAQRKANYDANEERYKQQAKEWRDANHAQVRENERAWKRANHGLVIAAAMLRKKHVKQRTPVWADLKAIFAFYAARPPGHHVDHIVPLRGKNVSGLHIETNLQYLPSTENLRKRNKF
jgi:hypothetical protein